MHTKKKHSDAPILEIPEPCDKAWDAMQRGEQGRRFCDSCSKHVYDISSMTRRDALSLLDENDWEICVNYEVNKDGNMRFKPEPPSRLQLQIEGARRLLAATAIVPIALSAACDGSGLRIGGDPVAVHQEHKAEALQPEQKGIIDTSTNTAQLKPGAGLVPTPPAQDDEPACDGVANPDDSKGERLEEADPTTHQIGHPRHGGAPRAIDRPTTKRDIPKEPKMEKPKKPKMGKVRRPTPTPFTDTP